MVANITSQWNSPIFAKVLNFEVSKKYDSTQPYWPYKATGVSSMNPIPNDFITITFSNLREGTPIYYVVVGPRNQINISLIANC